MRKMLLFANSSHPHQTVMEFSLPVKSQGSRHRILVYILGVPAIKLIFKVTEVSLVLSAADLCSNITMYVFFTIGRDIFLQDSISAA